MSNQAVIALQEIIKKLSISEQAYACNGSADHAMAWSPRTEITARLSIKGDDEIWVIAGSGILVRFIAASDGDFGDVVEVVEKILHGEAIEMFENSEGSTNREAVPAGYEIGAAGGFAGGLQSNDAAWIGRLAGPFAS